MIATATAVLHDFLSDLVDLKLLIIKSIYFTLLAGVVMLWPQLTLHQQQLGLTTYQTGICSSAMSLLTMLVPILAGFTGDKLGNYKVLMSIATAGAGLGAFLFTVVPSANTTTVYYLANGTTNNSLVNGMINGRDLTNGITNGSNLTYETTNLINGKINDSDLLNGRVTTVKVDPEKLTVTFWSYLVVRLLFGMFQSVGYTLYEGAVMAHVQERGINYGYQRAWGTMAVIVGSLLGGYLVDITSGFKMIFWMSAGLHVVSAGLMLLLTMNFKLPTQSLTREIFRYLLNVEVILLFSAMLAAGVLIGYLETFMYRYLVNLGASSMLVSLTVTVGAPFELLLTLLTSHLVRHIGHAPLIMFGLSAYAVRLVGLSMLVDPWWVLPLEALESVANGLLFTAAIMYCTLLFPMDIIASSRGIFAVVYFGVGKLLGTLIGSEVREVLGDRATFRVLAGIALAFALTYCLAFYTFRRRMSGILDLRTSPPTPASHHNVSQDIKAAQGTTQIAHDTFFKTLQPTVVTHPTTKHGISNYICRVDDE
nr:uncharacterized protein LOC128704073 isoform X1 [Cherax quadricarinatus]